MRVKELRLLALITGEIDDSLFRKIMDPPTDLAKDVLEHVKNNKIRLEIVGTEAKVYTCSSCGMWVDLDDNEDEDDYICSECGEGPMCQDCFDSHICGNDTGFED